MAQQTIQTTQARADKAYKPYIGMNMEGPIARWYAGNTARNLPAYQAAARKLAARLQPGAQVLEVAPGPGYLAVALAQLGNYAVSGLDISRTFVEIAQRTVQEAGVKVDFRQGDAAQMPFADDTFDLIVCRAAFKNFSTPVQALNEMRRVLKPGGAAVVQDLRKEATPAEIDAEVDSMHLGAINRWLTRWTFHNMLLKRAYTRADFERLAAASAFGGCTVETEGIEINVWLRKPQSARNAPATISQSAS